MKSFTELGINISSVKGQGKVLCPRCSHKRSKNPDEPCLSVNVESGQFHCHNCGWSGGTQPSNGYIKSKFTKKSFIRPSYDLKENKLTKETLEFFKGRGISKQTLEENLIGTSPMGHIAFPYIKDEVVNIKYRSLDKKFRLVAGAETPLYGIQNIFEDGKLATKKIFITEGEIDSLSLYECGFRYALSVPSGANVEEEGLTHITPKLEYLEDPDMSEVLEQVEEVVLVCDADYKGKRLRDELGKRLGVDRCSYVEYPDGCKDINEVLVKFGSDKVIELLLSPEPMMRGLETVRGHRDELVRYYNEGLEAGICTGVEAFDDVYTLKFGLITLVTGIPEIKKSVFLDNMTVRYAEAHDLHIAMFSPETKPLEFHIGRLASIHSGKSMNKDSANYMTYEEYTEATDWVDRHFSFIQPKKNTLEEILQLAKLSVLKYGTKILVIDPYSRMAVEEEAEDKFIRRMLNEVSEFAVRYGVHVFIVAHPTKVEAFKKPKTEMEVVNYPPITPYQIKGASEWFQSADFILSLWRDLRVDDSPTRVFVMKSKLWHIAKSNNYCELAYNFDNWVMSSYEGGLTNHATV
jgi:twinkle protein